MILQKRSASLLKTLFGGLFLALFASLSTSCSMQEAQPNIILCMADDLGWGDVGYNGNPAIQTPNLDAMAAAGIQFNRFYAGSSVCSPTRGSVLTGRNPFRYGVYSANKGHLKEEEVSLPEIFSELGYATGHFGKWHLGTMTPDFSGKKGRNPKNHYMTPGMAGNQEWFATEYAVATYDPYDPKNSHGRTGDPRSLYWHNGVNITEGLSGCDSKIIMDKAIPFIRRSVKKKKPFFAVIWFHAPHAPVVGHPEYMEKLYSEYSENEQHYYSVVTALDAQVGRLRDELKELGVAENTILAFTSDNGPEGNPGKRKKYQGSAGPFRGRKRSLYEGGVRVPGIIEYPALFKEQRVVDVPCVTSDYFPTLCKLAGLDIDDYQRPYDGVSLWGIMKGEQTERNSPIGFRFGKQQSMVDDRYKLVHNLKGVRSNSDNGSSPTSEYELYDIQNDPSETENIISEHPEITAQLKEDLEKWVASCDHSDQGGDYTLRSEQSKTFEPTWESLAEAKPATWWQDGKLGIFIHWGPYSVAGYRDQHKGYSEAITNDMYKRPELYKPFFMEKFGAAPPEFGYKDWVGLYTAEKWDPHAWARLFKEAGATYVIPTGEHHDGFVNWDSELTDWCATKMGPKRDLIGDLADAVREEGMKYGISYHRERHPSRFASGFHVIEEPYSQVAEEIKMVPEAAMLYGPFEYSDAFITDYVARWKEAEEKYRPDFLWVDDVPIFYHAEGDPQVIKFQEAFKGMIADYLNQAGEWGKEVYFNNKGKHLNFPEGVGCREKDNLQMDSIGPPWQNPATLGVSYAYMAHEDENDLYKTPAELVRLLVDVVSKNGNLLLNIGPRADGTIPEGMQTRLLALGDWLKVNGEAIYGSKPWLTYGEYAGEIIDEEGVHYSKHSMRIHETEYRYTTKPGVIFVTAFQPARGELTLSSFAGFDYGKIKSIKTIGGDKVDWKAGDQGLILLPGKEDNFSLATVYKISIEK